jgi:hypothetical protein
MMPDQSAGEEPFVDQLSDTPESLVLDIGGDVGALVLYADESCLGVEIDVTPAGHPRSHHTHTMIRRRRAVDREFVAGVYPELRAGAYTVWGIDGEVLTELVIAGGRVTEFDAGPCHGVASSDGPARGARRH